MKRSPMPRARTGVRARRPTPRQRVAPRWDAAGWSQADAVLQARARGLCDACGLPLRGACERHHRQRRRDGGDRLANLLVLHPACHQRWTLHPADARLRGIIVPAATADVALVPVLLHGTTWVRLDDEGRAVPCPAP